MVLLDWVHLSSMNYVMLCLPKLLKRQFAKWQNQHSSICTHWTMPITSVDTLEPCLGLWIEGPGVQVTHCIQYCMCTIMYMYSTLEHFLILLNQRRTVRGPDFKYTNLVLCPNSIIIHVPTTATCTYTCMCVHVCLYSTCVLHVCFSLFLSCRGINFVLSALVFNVFPTIFEVSLVSAILVSCMRITTAACTYMCICVHA